MKTINIYIGQTSTHLYSGSCDVKLRNITLKENIYNLKRMYLENPAHITIDSLTFVTACAKVISIVHDAVHLEPMAQL